MSYHTLRQQYGNGEIGAYSLLDSIDELASHICQQAETIRCQQIVLDKMGAMLGVEVKRDGLDVDRIVGAVESLMIDRDAAAMQLRDMTNAAYTEVEIAALRQDAARYRFLRARGGMTWSLTWKGREGMAPRSAVDEDYDDLVDDRMNEAQMDEALAAGEAE